MLAHIVGVPVEESLLWLIPIGGLGLGALGAQLRARLPGVRRTG